MKITNFVTPGEKPAFKQIFTEHLLYNRQCEGLKKNQCQISQFRDKVERLRCISLLMKRISTVHYHQSL